MLKINPPLKTIKINNNKIILIIKENKKMDYPPCHLIKIHRHNNNQDNKTNMIKINNYIDNYNKKIKVIFKSEVMTILNNLQDNLKEI